MSNNNIKNIISKNINDKFSSATYAGIEIIIDNENGFVNGTKLCKFNKSRPFYNWVGKKNHGQRAINNFKNYYKMEVIHNKYSQCNGKYVTNQTKGTYIHMKLVPIVMQWHCDEFQIQVSELVNKYFIRKELRRLDEKWEREMAKQAKLHKNTVRKKNRRIKKKKCVIEKLREEMKKYQEQTMRGIGVLKEKHDEAKQQRDEAKQQRDEATELLVEAKEERDEAKEDFDILNNKVDKIVNHIVPPAIRHSKSENCIVFKIPRTTKSKKISDFRRRKDNQLPQYMDYYVSCCQSYSVDGVKERIMKKHGAKPIIIKKMKPSPNSKNIFHRFQEKYGATLAKSKKAKKPVVYNYNYVGLYGTTTEADIIRFLDEVEAEKEFRHEEV
jgi:hypothetical protein